MNNKQQHQQQFSREFLKSHPFRITEGLFDIAKEVGEQFLREEEDARISRK